MDDFQPYIFRTNDYGATWTQIAGGNNGIPEDHFVRVVREDPNRKGLLYAGTEFGLYISSDDGVSWKSFQLDLPVTPVTDLAVAHQDLVVATQGRSFWILDDLTPLHQLSGDSFEGDVQLLTPRDTYRFGGGFFWSRAGVAGKNPPAGAMIHYYLDTAPEEEVKLEILDTEGNVLRTLSSEKEEPQAPSPWRQFLPGAEPPRKLKAEAGVNRYVWNLRLHDAELVKDAVLWGFANGPKVPPGTYQARLSMGDSTQTTSFQVKADPRIDTSEADFDAQFELAKSISQSVTDSHTALRKIRDVRGQVEDLAQRLVGVGKAEGLEEPAKAVTDRLTEIEKKIYQTRNESVQDILNYPPKLDNQLVGLMSVVESGDTRPTDGAVAHYQELAAQLAGLEAEIDSVVSTELAAFDELVRQRHPEAVIVP
jgi:hypothetical protein